MLFITWSRRKLNRRCWCHILRVGGHVSDLLFRLLSPLSGPQILRCIAENFSPSDFIGHPDGGIANTEFGSHLVGNSKTENRTAYYIKLGMGRFGLMLPGLGYDCFRFDNPSSLLPIVFFEGIGKCCLLVPLGLWSVELDSIEWCVNVLPLSCLSLSSSGGSLFSLSMIFTK